MPATLASISTSRPRTATSASRSALLLAPALLAGLGGLGAAGCGGEDTHGNGTDAGVSSGTDAHVPPGTDAHVAPGTDAHVAPGTDAGQQARDAGGAATTDSGVATADAGTMTSDAGPSGATCGTMRPTISGIRGTEGLVIARDGTIYYSQSGAVGRVTTAGAHNDNWVTLTGGASTVWGLALDEANAALYVAVPSAGAIYKVDVDAASGAPWLTGAGQPNGMTVGPDGALYFSDFSGGHVYRVDLTAATPTKVRVTTMTISGANGVAFGPDGRLYVDSYGTGTLQALTLSDTHVEASRDRIASSLGSPDGLAFDATGNIYVTDNSGGRLIRLAPDGSAPMVLRMGIGAAASIEFGTGALPCSDVYVASSGALVRYEGGTTAGAAVPWH